ncbi:hypothetical protein GcM1_225064 [Golovinomyces cichoracearum]|uniref:Uncharacterized protein n=1 Tax=Golovinomyces cichoracearum TaxID=62708 RepID=A0A420IQE0_9PEZI|nr:hypothetical protein GcM1_225064 [Golovinomyces cichoracearum]
MWNEIKKAKSTLRRNWAHLRDIFADEKATAPILKYIQSTGIGRKYNEESEEQRNNFYQENIGIADLEEHEDPVV